MVALLVQCAIISLWAATLSVHMRRLFRLAGIAVPAILRERRLRHELERMWWWLGREEFWRAVQSDSLRCLQLTLMIFILVWGTHL